MDNNSKVVVYETAKGSAGYDASCLNNMGLQRLAHDIGDTNRDVKQSEAEIRSDIKDVRFDVAKSESEVRRDIAKSECDIRHDVMSQGQENIKTTMSAECNLSKEILQTKCELKDEIIKQGYENRLLQKDTLIAMKDESRYLSDRLGDKVAHSLEEVREDLGALSKQVASCCCKGELANANTQNGLVNIQNLLSSLVGNVK